MEINKDAGTTARLGAAAMGEGRAWRRRDTMCHTCREDLTGLAQGLGWEKMEREFLVSLSEPPAG